MGALCRIITVVVLLLPAAAAAQGAQTASQTRPYRGVFGAPPDPAQERLVLNVTLGGGYDDNVLAADDTLSGGFDPLRSRQSTTGFLTTTLGYNRPAGRVSLGASVASTARYYEAFASRLVARHSASGNLGFRLSSRTGLSVSQRASYEPFYSLWAAGTPTAPGVDPDAVFDPNTQTQIGNRLRFQTSLALSHQLARRLTMSADYNLQSSASGAAGFDLRVQQSGLRFSYLVGRGVGVRLGYRFTTGRFGGATSTAEAFDNHGFDAGLDFDQALSLGRHTTLSFGAGVVGVENQDRVQYRATGNVQLRRNIGQSWSASVGFDRSVRYIDTYRRPVFADSLGVATGGLLGSRLTLGLGAGTSRGSIGGAVQGGSNQFRTYYGRIGVTIGLARNVGLGLDYSYSRYRYGDEILLPNGLPRRVGRQGIQVALQVAPLFSWVRR